MASHEKNRKLFLPFATVAEFDKALDRSGADTGFFLEGFRSLSIGEQVTIVISVKGSPGQVFLEGRVIWRRARSGGRKMPSGVFIGLIERDRARIDGIFKFLKSPGTRERRMHQRFHVDLDASYRTSKGAFPSSVSNLSRGGAFLRCMGPLLTVGARFPLELRPRREKTDKIPLNVRVAWIDYFEDTQGMGVVFVKGQPQLKKVQRLVDGYEKIMKQPKSSAG
ncbi:MAG TPA: PilZ domain-containing protein [Myxococcota bacterium]|nr:PilZ domain-containing protein [Myxococcota bacterium]